MTGWPTGTTPDGAMYLQGKWRTTRAAGRQRNCGSCVRKRDPSQFVYPPRQTATNEKETQMQEQTQELMPRVNLLRLLHGCYMICAPPDLCAKSGIFFFFFFFLSSLSFFLFFSFFPSFFFAHSRAAFSRYYYFSGYIFGRLRDIRRPCDENLRSLLSPRLSFSGSPLAISRPQELSSVKQHSLTDSSFLS